MVRLLRRFQLKENPQKNKTFPINLMMFAMVSDYIMRARDKNIDTFGDSLLSSVGSCVALIHGQFAFVSCN